VIRKNKKKTIRFEIYLTDLEISSRIKPSQTLKNLGLNVERSLADLCLGLNWPC
jgi:hypothetical protein